jgi:hypothetical protein
MAERVGGVLFNSWFDVNHNKQYSHLSLSDKQLYFGVVLDNLQTNLNKWSTGTMATAPCNFSGYVSDLNVCNMVALALPQLQAWGVNSTKVNTLKTWAASVWTGHNFDTDLAASCSMVTSDNGTWPSCSNQLGP